MRVVIGANSAGAFGSIEAMQYSASSLQYIFSSSMYEANSNINYPL